MSDRITMEMLNATLDYINRLTGIEHTIEGAYGGRKLCRNEGSVNVFHLGYVSKRELYDMMQAYARGFELLRIVNDNQHAHPYTSTDVELIHNVREAWGVECVCGQHEMDCNKYCCREGCMKPVTTALAERLGVTYIARTGEFIQTEPLKGGKYG